MEEHYKSLNGWKLSNFKFIGEGYDARPTFTISKPKHKKYTLVICQDPEDNGPGFLHIDELATQ